MAGLTFNLGRLSPSIFTDSSLNIGIGAAPSGSYKFEVTGTGRFSNTVYINNNTGGAGLSMTNTAAPNITGIGSPTRGMILNGLSTTAAATGAAFYFYGATSSYTSLTSGDLLQVTNNDAVKFRLDYAGAATFSSSVTAASGIINGTTDAFFDINRSASGNAGRVRFQTAGTDEFEIGLKGGVAGFHITKGDATELVTVLTSGNVGIGRTDPPYPLSVASPYAKTDTTGRSLAFFSSNEAIASNPFGLFVTITGAAALANRVIQLGTADYGLANGGSLALQVSGGNVGIGTTSPTDSIIGSGTFLDIAGTGGGALKLHFTNATAYGEFSLYKGSNGSYIDSAGAATVANNDLIFRTGGTASNYGVTERLRIASTGAATFSGQIISTSASDILAATSSNTSYKWINLANTGGNLVVGLNNSAGGATMTTSAYASYIFTRNATNLVLGTNEVPRLTLASTGAATFSSSVTAQALDIISASGVGSSTASGLARFITAATTPAISIGQSSNARRMDLYSYVINVTGEEFNLTTIDSQPIKLNTAATLRMIITGSGNVGIGSTAPDQKLTIQAAGTANGLISFKNSAGTTTNLIGQPNAAGDVISTSGTDDLCFRTQNGNMLFALSNIEFARFTPGGNLLLGTTTNAGYILEVNGTARATNLRATTDLYLDRTGVAPAIVLNQSSIRMVDAAGSSTVTLSSISGNFQVSGALKTAAPSGGTAQTFKVGSYVGGAPSATGYVQVEINGTVYKLLTST